MAVQPPSARVEASGLAREGPPSTGASGPPDGSLPSSVHVGEVIAGKYRLDRIRGAGGMGVVVEARHLHLHRRMAIKFMSPLLRNDPRGVQRFMLEARAASRIQCEHVVRVFDVALLDDGAPYIVMEYLEGEDLGELLRLRGKIPVAEAVDYILQASEALAEAHHAGIVHRDLKPGNLFRCKRADGAPLVKVLDFGVSKLLPKADLTLPEVPTTAAHVIIGSPPYSSPEQLRGPNDVDGRTDIWALGVILYELVAGRSPFAAEMFLDVCSKVMHAPPVPLAGKMPEVPRRFDAVVARALAKDRNARFQSLADLAEALSPFATPGGLLSVERIRSILGGSPRQVGREGSMRGRGPRPHVRHARAALYGAALLALATLLAVWASITSMAGAAEPDTSPLSSAVAP